MSAPRFIVMTASAQVPASWRGIHRRVAVVELEPGFEGLPAMISERAKGVVRIVDAWEKLRVGKTARSEYARALVEAEALAAQLNSN